MASNTADHFMSYTFVCKHDWPDCAPEVFGTVSTKEQLLCVKFKRTEGLKLNTGGEFFSFVTNHST